MSVSPKPLDGLTVEEKRALLAELLHKKASAGVAHYAPSFSQQRLWFLNQLAPENPSYNVPVAMHLSGHLHTAALEKSLNEIARRHEALRTTFNTVDGAPVQVIASSPALALPVTDLERVPLQRRADEIRRLANEQARLPFDLSRGPLVRTMLLRLGVEEHVLLLTIHHIVSDGWSMGVFIREMAALYECFSNNRPSTLPELPIQYRDFVAWQRQSLSGKTLEAQTEFWKQELAGLPVLQLPTDRPRPPINTYRGATEYFKWPKPLSERLKVLSRDTGVTLFMTLLAAFMALLHRYTAQDEIVVGSPMHNRTHGEIEGLIGFFVNALVLRTDLSGNPTFRELLSRVGDVALRAYAHQDLPFEQLVEVLQPERDLSRHPLFQVMFVLQNAPMPELKLPGLTLSPLEVDNGTSKFDFTMFLWDTADGLKGSLEYSTDLFDAATMVRMLGHLQRMLQAISINPEERIGNLPLLSDAERRQILVDWKGDERVERAALSIPELFDEQVRMRPDAAAVVFGDQTLTYRELDAWSNNVADALQQRGVGPEVVVGICIERSLELICGLLGILKAGGAYLALDPSYPADRTAFMLDDSHAGAILTTERFADRLPSGSTAVIFMDGTVVSRTLTAISKRAARLSPDNMAYVTYTSGSTGRPKGTCISHRNVGRLVKDVNYADLDAQQTFLHLAPVTFDASTFEIWGCLLNGGRLVVHPPQMPSLEELGQALSQFEISTVWLTAGLFHQLVENHAEDLRNIRQLLAGGDVLSVPHVKKAVEHLRQGKLINGYGPTETTTFACCYSLSDATHLTHALPIGRPISRTTVFLLDTRLQPVPPGIPGELFIGGDGLARCYLNEPGLTAERFIPHSFSTCPGERLYRTGDLARFLPDGNIDFLGRVDDQVKIRGYRVEPGEIEAVLNEHPDVQESVVVPFAEVSGDKRLVAYAVSEFRSEDAAPALLRYLKERLPDHLVPSAVVLLDKFPLTENGKVDRRALPVPGRKRPELSPELSGVHAEPRTALEKGLANLWAQVLGVEHVGIHDNFFELGGHSLLATQLITKIRSTFHVRLALSTLFSSPTVASMAPIIAEKKGTQADEGSLPALRRVVAAPEQRHEPFPLTDVQQAFWLGRTAAFELGNVSTQYYAELEGPALDLERFQSALRRLIDRHEMLRAIVLPEGRQKILSQVPAYEITIVDLRGRDRAEVEEQLMAVRQRMTTQVFPSDRWPLFEIVASLVDSGFVRLHIMVDALVSDAWSGEILDRELYQFYEHPERELPPLSLSFRDYVSAEAALQNEPAVLRSQEYWRERINVLPHAPELPLARHPSTILQPRFVARSGRLDARSWARLKTRASQAGVTPSGVLLTAFAEVLSAWSKSARLTINLSVSNRLPLHPQVNDIAGNFTSLILLGVDHSARESFESRARRLQEQLWKDLEHRYVSGVRVLRDLVRAQGGSPRAAMPIVFTSTLTYGADGKSNFSGLAKVVHSISRAPQVWLEQHVLEEQGALVFRWDMVDELFPEGLPSNMFDAYTALLRRLSEQDQAWSETARHIVPAAELSERAAINATQSPLSAALLHSLFEAETAKRPVQPAVISSQRILSYEELSRKANQTGRALRARGALPNTLVAVVMEKGWEQIVAVLGILGSGAAYLPIDPHLPKERVHYLLEHGQVKWVLTQSWIDRDLQWPGGIDRLRIDLDDCAGEDCAPLEAAQGQSDLAYVIFTSGSTGLPKGVMIDHRGAVNTILDINTRFGIGPEDRVLALSSLGFDLSVYDIFGVLAAGGTIVMPDAPALRDPGHWAQLIARERITVWNTAPALMSMLAEYMKDRAEAESALDLLRLVLLSGDWIPVSLPDQVHSFAHSARIISLGGATEASIWSILYPIATIDHSWKSIPYGKPMANQQIHVLNEAMEPCPVWVPGQLYIGGIGLALGYWRDEEKTNNSFVTHPVTGLRLYRSGDLGRYLPDGNVEFLGREDSQVKIRGHRIELGEIEAQLSQHPGVSAVVVWPEGEARDNRRLIAYVVAGEDSKPAPEQLRRFIEAKLPDYMVPSAFVLLAELPLTANGKLDTKRLPSPESLETPASYVAPRTGTERAIAAIWQEVLSLSKVSMDHSFFELGGDSALMVRVQNRLMAALQKEIPIAAMFTHPTVPELAAFLDRQDSARCTFAPVEERARKQKEALKRQKLRFRERTNSRD